MSYIKRKIDDIYFDYIRQGKEQDLIDSGMSVDEIEAVKELFKDFEEFEKELEEES